jgi:hypothetical protein
VGETDLDDKLHRLGLILERAGRADNADTVHRAISVISILSAKSEMLACRVEQLEASLAAANAEVERLRPREMTLDEACEVLSSKRYDDFAEWTNCMFFDPAGIPVFRAWNGGYSITQGAAVYIAQGLLRDGGEGGGE